MKIDQGSASDGSPRPERDGSGRVLRGPLVALLLAFAVFAGFSLPHLADPPIGTHGWRMAIATSMARLYAEGQPFLYPRAEGCGDRPGVYMASEFPLYAWVMGKLGGAHGINLAGRLLALASALLLMLGTYAIARWALQRWAEPWRSVGAVAAGGFFAFSPLFRWYGISFVPDLHAHALALAGIGVLAGTLGPREAPLTWRRTGASFVPDLHAHALALAGIGVLAGTLGPREAPLTWRRTGAGSALLALAALTKLIVVPHLALAVAVVLDRSRPRPGALALRSARPWLRAAGLLALVMVPVWLWYGAWVPALKAGGCDMVWLPEKLDDSWRTMTFSDAEWRRRMSTWGREDLLGRAWPLCLAGLLVMGRAGARGWILLAWALGCAAGYVRLGWHTKQHDYDFLLVLPAFALGFGVALGSGLRTVAAFARRVAPRPMAAGPRIRGALPWFALAAVFALLAPHAHRQSRRHFYTSLDEVGLELALDRVLPRDEPIHYFGSVHDPRLPYFARRKALGTEPWHYCQKRHVRYDCALATGLQGRLAPCIERAPSVIWPDRALVCGILQPSSPLAAPRILETIARTVRIPVGRAVPGHGTVLGADPVQCGEGLRLPCAGLLEPTRYLDVYFLPEREGPAVELLAGGRQLPLEPDPTRWIPGAVVVARARLPELASRLELRVGTELFDLSDR